MTDTPPSASSVVYGIFDGNRPSPSPTDALASVALSPHLPPTVLLSSKTSDPASQHPGSPHAPGMIQRGKVRMNATTLRGLREARLLSQQDLADDCWRRNVRVSIATIKRAETGHDVRFRIARELARYFGVSFDDLLR